MVRLIPARRITIWGRGLALLNHQSTAPSRRNSDVQRQGHMQFLGSMHLGPGKRLQFFRESFYWPQVEHLQLRAAGHNNSRSVLWQPPRRYWCEDEPAPLGISKRSDRYLCSLLMHRARTVIYRIRDASILRALGLNQLIERRGVNRAAVALAHKMARVAQAVPVREEVYQATRLKVAPLRKDGWLRQTAQCPITQNRPPADLRGTRHPDAAVVTRESGANFHQGWEAPAFVNKPNI